MTATGQGQEKAVSVRLCSLTRHATLHKPEEVEKWEKSPTINQTSITFRALAFFMAFARPSTRN